MVPWTFEAIGTRWDITHPLVGADAARMQEMVINRIDAFDRAYSRFRSDSLIAEIGRKPGTYEMPADFSPLFAVYTTLFDITGGLFTPCIGAALEDLGYDRTYSFEQKSVRPLAEFKTVTFDGTYLHTHEPVLLDFGAGGKGYLIDIVAEILGKQCDSFVINAGGDIRGQGNDALRVGLEDPAAVENALGVIEIQNESICGSAGNRRAWGDVHHILDPRTSTSPKEITATWVIATTAMDADALSTALFFVPAERLRDHFEFQWAVLSVDRSVQFSERFKGVFF